MPTPFQQSAAVLDLSPRVFKTATVVGSPAAASETIISSITINQDIQTVVGVILFATCAFTVGASGVSATYKIRRTDASGSTVYSSGATTKVAADLAEMTATAFDTFAVSPGGVYVATLTIGSGAATSTVSTATLVAIVV